MSIIDHAVAKISTLLGISTTTASSTLEALLDTREQQRIAQVQRFWNMYNGLHYDYRRDDGEMPFFNAVYGMVEKSISWLVGTPPVIRGRTDLQALHEELVLEILENSGNGGTHGLFYEAVQMGSVSGDCILQVGYDPDVNYEKGGIVIKVLDSERTFFEYRNLGQRRKLSRVMMIWDELDAQGYLRTFSEVWSDAEVRIYPPGRILSVRNVAAIDASYTSEAEPEILTDGDGNEYTVYPNPYGELPFVHIPNLLISQNSHGRSDVHDLWVLNKEINEQLLSYKDNVDYHGNPITLLFGLSSKSVEKGANKVWGNLPKDSRIENLEVSQTHEPILQYIKLLKEGIGVSNFPPHLLALSESIASDTSAAAMRLAYLPLIELTDRKKISYGQGFKEAVEMALRFTNSLFELGLESLNAPEPKLSSKLNSITSLPEATRVKISGLRERPYYYTEIQFQDHLPRNRTMELADLEVEIRNKLESLSGAMRRLGVKDPEEKMNEILQDKDFEGSADRIALDASKSDAEVIQDEMTIADAEASVAASEGAPAIDIPPEQLSAAQQAGPEGGRGNKKTPQNANAVENNTGQGSDRTSVQRTLKGKGEI